MLLFTIALLVAASRAYPCRDIPGVKVSTDFCRRATLLNDDFTGRARCTTPKHRLMKNLLSSCNEPLPVEAVDLRGRYYYGSNETASIEIEQCGYRVVIKDYRLGTIRDGWTTGVRDGGAHTWEWDGTECVRRHLSMTWNKTAAGTNLVVMDTEKGTKDVYIFGAYYRVLIVASWDESVMFSGYRQPFVEHDDATCEIDDVTKLGVNEGQIPNCW